MEKLLQSERQKVSLATEIIRTLKKIIFVLIITNVITVLGFIWYISLPVESTENQSVSQYSDNASTNNYIEGDYIGSETNNN